MQVYAIQGERTGLIKFGMGYNARYRISTQQTNSPDKFVVLFIIQYETWKLARKQEAAIHAELWQSRSHGEWFRPSKETMMVVKRMADPFRIYRDFELIESDMSAKTFNKILCDTYS